MSNPVKASNSCWKETEVLHCKGWRSPVSLSVYKCILGEKRRGRRDGGALCCQGYKGGITYHICFVRVMLICFCRRLQMKSQHPEVNWPHVCCQRSSEQLWANAALKLRLSSSAASGNFKLRWSLISIQQRTEGVIDPDDRHLTVWLSIKLWKRVHQCAWVHEANTWLKWCQMLEVGE